MTPEVISTVAASAGYAVGLVGQYTAERQAVNNTVRLQLEAATTAVERDAAQAESERQMKFRKWVGRNATAPVALLASSVIGAFTYGMTQKPATEYQAPATNVEMVVDHSGATGLEFENEMPASQQINVIAEQFINEDIEGEALIASNGKVTSAEIEDVTANEPFGNAPIKQATNLAFEKSQNGNVLVITNGNKLGDTEALAEKAEQTNSKVFVVNIETVDQPKNKLQAEQQLAEDTGGKYWKADEDNLDNVAKEVKDTVQPAEQGKDGSGKWPFAVFGAIGLAGIFGVRRRTKKGQIIPGKSPKGV